MRLSHKLFLLFTDVILILGSLLLALVIRFHSSIPDKYLSGEMVPYFSLCAFSAGVMWLFGMYNKLWRYASINEGIYIFEAVTVSFGVFAIPVFFTHGSFYPRSVTIMAWLLAIFLLGSVRVLLRLASSGFVVSRGRKRVVVVGSGDPVESVIRNLKTDRSAYWPVGILDQDGKHKNVKIHGVPILGSRSDLPDIIRERKIQEVVVTDHSPVVFKEVLNLCKGLNVDFKTIPGIHELMDGRVRLNPIREIRFEDLLGREEIQISLESVRSYLYGKKVLVTGAGGSIGSELCRQIIEFEPNQLILIGHGENSIYEILLELSAKGFSSVVPVIADIRDEQQMRKIFSEKKPSILFHAAAHKHVPFMELQPFEAISNNFLSTQLLAKLSAEFSLDKFIFLSTDKAIQPSSIMGATKRLCEMYLRSFNQNHPSMQFISVRFGNVLDSRGSVIPTFRKQIAMGGPVTVTHPEMTRYFMTIPEAVKLVLQAAAMGKGGEIFLLDMGRPINIMELANQMIRLAGYEPNKDISIKVIGPRPGEKLTEKLVSDDEIKEQSPFEKIHSIRSRTYPLEDLEKAIQDIRKFAVNEDEENLMELISKFIPEFRSRLRHEIKS
jgi:FlaA1/EpsC-like NDP-sugar epimerase